MTRRVRIAVLLLSCLATVWLLWRVRRVLTPLLLAALLSYLLLPAVQLLERRKVPRGPAILILYAGLGCAAAALLWLVLPYLAAEIEALATAFPEQTARLEDLTLDILKRLERTSLPAAVREAAADLTLRAEQTLAAALSRVAGGILGLFTGVFYLLLAPVLAYFIMRDWPALRQSVLMLFPPRHHGHLVTLGRRIDEVLSGYIRGQLIVSSVIGLLIAAGLAVLGVRYALVLGLIAGAFNVVPYFGPLMGAVPAVMLALLESPATALWTVALFFGVNQLESAVLSPKVVGDMVGLHPITVILAVLAGAELSGLFGMLLAVPFAAVLKVGGQVLAERWMRP